MLNKRHKIELSAFLLLLGGCIYLIYRSTSLVMFTWVHFIGLDNILYSLRDSMQNYTPPYFVLYCTPNMLWISSYLLLIDTLDLKYYSKMFWSLILPSIAITFEFLQIWGIIPGTFDIWDLVCLSIPTIIYLITLNNKQYEKSI